MAARWKMNPRETGLRRVGAGPRGARLFDNGIEIASVSALGGDWKGPIRGWYWYGFGKNTCNSTVSTIEEAKAQAMAFYQEIKKQK